MPIYFGGWPISLYLYYHAWRNFGSLLRNYPKYLAGYGVGGYQGRVIDCLGRRHADLTRLLLQGRAAERQADPQPD